MVWVMNVPCALLGKEFNIVGGVAGPAVIFARREGVMEDTGRVGVYSNDPALLHFVEVDATEPEHVMATIQANKALREELVRLQVVPRVLEAA